MRNKGAITAAALITTALSFTGITLALFGYNYNANNGNAGQIQTIKQELSNKGERISATESTLKEYDKRLESIDKKLDRLIEFQLKINNEKNY